VQGAWRPLSTQSAPYDRRQLARSISNMVGKNQNEIPQFIRRVMPNAMDAELREATANFDEYMAVVWEIFDRIKRERGESDSPNSGVCDRFDDIDQSI
jgi:hypothetical protein